MTKAALSRSLRYVFITLCNRGSSHWTARKTKQNNAIIFCPVFTNPVYSVFSTWIESRLWSTKVKLSVFSCILSGIFFRIRRLSSVVETNPRNFAAVFLSPNVLAVFQTEKCYYPSSKCTPTIVRQSIRQLNKCQPPRQHHEISSSYNFQSRNASNYTRIESTKFVDPASKKFTWT